MNNLWIAALGLGMGLILIFKPVWIRRDGTLTDSSKREFKKIGFTLLGSSALIAWLDKIHPYKLILPLLGLVGGVWLILKAKDSSSSKEFGYKTVLEMFLQACFWVFIAVPIGFFVSRVILNLIQEHS
jgi:hypothetical protein